MENIYEKIARQLAIQNRIAILKCLMNVQYLEPDEYIQELRNTIDIVDDDINEE